MTPVAGRVVYKSTRTIIGRGEGGSGVLYDSSCCWERERAERLFFWQRLFLQRNQNYRTREGEGVRCTVWLCSCWREREEADPTVRLQRGRGLSTFAPGPAPSVRGGSSNMGWGDVGQVHVRVLYDRTGQTQCRGRRCGLVSIREAVGLRLFFVC